MMPSAASRPAPTSATAQPTRIGPSPGLPVTDMMPREPLRDLVEARPRAVGAVLAEAGNAREDDARVDLLQRLVVDAEPVLHVGAVVLDHHVRRLHQAQ